MFKAKVLRTIGLANTLYSFCGRYLVFSSTMSNKVWLLEVRFSLPQQNTNSVKHM